MNGDFYNFGLVSDLITAYCKQNDLNESDYATLIGVQPPSLSRIKAGKGCSPETLAKIAALGGISIRELMTEEPAGVKEQLYAAGQANGLPVSV